MTALAGTHAIVTGGSEGIGLATAAALLDRDARVSIVSRNSEKLAAAQARLGGAVLTAAADVADAPALERAVRDLTTEAGPCDVLVTSAGYSYPERFERIPLEVFRHQMDVNYLGTVHAIRAVLPSMRARRRGHLVVISSDVGLFGVFGFTAYAPTKFAVRGLAESLRGEVKPDGVRVSIVYPPDTETPGLERENEIKPEETKRISAGIKPRTAEQVARAIVRGIERNRLTITADPLSTVLARAIGLLGPVARASEDRIVRQVRRERAG